MPEPFRLFVVGDPAPSRSASHSPLVAMAEFAGARAIERVEVDGTWLRAQARSVADLRSFLLTSKPAIDRGRLQSIGRHLFDRFVTGGVRSLFDSSAGNGAGNGAQLTPCELFIESGAAAEWPWEFLCSGPKFLCESFHPVSRGVFTPDDSPHRTGRREATGHPRGAGDGARGPMSRRERAEEGDPQRVPAVPRVGRGRPRHRAGRVAPGALRGVESGSGTPSSTTLATARST